uniref:MyTH4 domain-containing protein n=1 Tax=Pelusios castaneus TaxID=367368 RepID=A0A8C8RYS9_9SAUR
MVGSHGTPQTLLTEPAIRTSAWRSSVLAPKTRLCSSVVTHTPTPGHSRMHAPGLQPRHPSTKSNSNAGLFLPALMRFMGDQPSPKNQTEMDHVYEILQLCKEKANLHDEVYCQVIKQMSRDEHVCNRGWQLLNLLTGFFPPSTTLMPYATKFLQQASAQPASTHEGTSRSPGPAPCTGLGGLVWLDLPFPQESVTGEVVQEICEQMGISELEEIKEFALFASKRKMVRPMRQDEYVHDYLLEDSSVALDLRRVSWKTPLHFENEIYISAHYSQVASAVSAIHAGLGPAATEQSPGALALLTRVGAVCGFWMYPLAQPLFSLPAEYVLLLPLFGYNVYPVERCSEPRIPLPGVVGVNRDEIIVQTSTSQELCCLIPLLEVQRVRTLGPLDDSGVPGLEVNYGSVDNPKTMWFELQQTQPPCIRGGWAKATPWPILGHAPSFLPCFI